MTLLGSIAFMALGALLLGFAACVAFAPIWRWWREPKPGGLGAMLARHGLDWSRLAAVGSAGEVATALDRCDACCAKARCDEWLGSGEREGYQRFCPNASFVERMKGALQH